MYIGQRQQKHTAGAYDCTHDPYHTTCYIIRNPNGSYRVVHTRCRKLICNHCSKIAKQIMWRSCKAAAETYGLCCEYTLTIAGDLNPLAQSEKLVEARTKLLTGIRNHPKAPVSYIWCLGAGKENGRLHIHLYTNKDVWLRRRANGSSRARAWMKPYWRSLTGAFARRNPNRMTPDMIADYVPKNVLEAARYGRTFTAHLYGGSKGISVMPRFKPAKRVEAFYSPYSAARLAECLGVDIGIKGMNTDFDIPAGMGVSTFIESTQGRGVLPAGGAAGSTSGPATAEPGGAPASTGEAAS